MRTIQTLTPEESEERATTLSNYKLYTLEECEPILGVKKRTLLEYARKGKLKAVKAGGQWKVSEEALKEFTSRREIYMIRENADLRRRLAEQTDKHWECNRQIAHYSDELRKHEAVKAIECERRNKRCLGCPFDGVVCNEQH